jgi:hypothetical protein
MNSHVVDCPYCRAKILLDAEHFGRMNECPECKGQFIAPPMTCVVVPAIAPPTSHRVAMAAAPLVQTQTNNLSRRYSRRGLLLVVICLPVMLGALVVVEKLWSVLPSAVGQTVSASTMAVVIGVGCGIVGLALMIVGRLEE